MRCCGAGSADRVLFLLLDERRGVEGGGVADGLGSLRGWGAVAVGQALGRVAQDCQGLGDGVQGGSPQVLAEGIETYGLGWRLRRSLGNLGCRGGSGTR